MVAFLGQVGAEACRLPYDHSRKACRRADRRCNEEISILWSQGNISEDRPIDYRSTDESVSWAEYCCEVIV